jgi:D-alanyl-D-alanine carboxypeptidase (penicillin-binding protein 5/6)
MSFIKKTAAAALAALILLSGASGAIFDIKDVFGPGSDTLQLLSRAAVLMDAATGEIVYAKDADKAYPAPGLAKLMTSILFMEALENGQISMDENILVSDGAARTGGASQAVIGAGERCVEGGKLGAGRGQI